MSLVGVSSEPKMPLEFQESLLSVLNSCGIPALAFKPNASYKSFKRFSCVIQLYPSVKPCVDYGSFRTRSKLLATQLARSIPATLRASPSLRYRARIPFLVHTPVPCVRVGVPNMDARTAQLLFIGISNYLILTEEP